jgi:hypothetical protein
MSSQIAVAHLSPLVRLRLRLLQPEAHVHLAVQRRCVSQVLAGLLALACVPAELTEAEVAVSDEWAHPQSFGNRERLPVVGLSSFSIKSVKTDSEVGEQVQRMGHVAGMRP